MKHSIQPMNSWSTLPQLSPKMLENLGKNPIIINGDAQKLAMLAQLIHAIIEIGEIEHSGDWDPYLSITLTDGKSFETPSGYPEILFGDFNDEEQFTTLMHFEEITTVGFYLGYLGEDEEPRITYFPLSDIASIGIFE